MNHHLFSRKISIYRISKHQTETLFLPQLTEDEIYEKIIKCNEKKLENIDRITVKQTTNGNISNEEMTMTLKESDEFEGMEMIVYFPKWACFYLSQSPSYETLDYHHFYVVKMTETFLKEHQREIVFRYSSFLENKNINGSYHFMINAPLVRNDHSYVEIEVTMVSAIEFKRNFKIDGKMFENMSIEDVQKEVADIAELIDRNEILYKGILVKSKKPNLMQQENDLYIIIEGHLLISSILCDEKMSPFLFDESKSFVNLSTKRTDCFGAYLNVYNFPATSMEKQVETSCIFVIDLLNLPLDKIPHIQFTLDLVKNEFKKNEILTIFRVLEKHSFLKQMTMQ